MNNEVRKPRVFKNVVHVKTHSMEGVVSVTHEINLLPFKIDLQEILPGDDSIRDLALAKIRLKRAEDAAYRALLHMSAWLGIPDKKREQFIEDEMGNVRFCCQNNLPQDLERIERESKGE